QRGTLHASQSVNQPSQHTQLDRDPRTLVDQLSRTPRSPLTSGLSGPAVSRVSRVCSLSPRAPQHSAPTEYAEQKPPPFRNANEVHTACMGNGWTPEVQS